MSEVKIAVLGAGSFVFGPSFLHDILVDHRQSRLHLALVDPNAQVVELMAGLGRRLARDGGLQCTITTHATRDAAFDGADFVVCSAARELYRRFAMDCEIVRRIYPSHLITEFGGVAGISYSLRQIAFIQEVCADMRRLCPKAPLLDAANPLPRVCQAAQEEGIDTVGFCSASLWGYSMVWQMLKGQSLEYPFEPGYSQLDVTMGGMNHFSWLIGLRERATGRDLMPDLKQAARQGRNAGQPMSARLLLETGYFPMPGDNHIKDFLAPTGEVQSRKEASHGSPEERQARLDWLRDVGEGKTAWDPTRMPRSWERPADLIVAKVAGKRFEFSSLNRPNRGQIPGLPNGVFVETAATMDGPQEYLGTLQLPEPILSMCRRTAEVTDAIVKAARGRSKALLRRAVELDPTITDKSAGWAAVEECLVAHADQLPEYA